MTAPVLDSEPVAGRVKIAPIGVACFTVCCPVKISQPSPS
ncbi:Uncharacterised protein [Vibrio cholerae]|nr:Uncharacterised protein [Vibrio cholerae]